MITSVPSADRQATVRVRIGFDKLDPRILPDMGVKVSFLSEAPEPVVAGAAAQPRLLVPKGGADRRRDGDCLRGSANGSSVAR